MPIKPELHWNADLALGEPGKALRLDAYPADAGIAVHLAAFHGDVDLRGAFVARDDAEFQAEHRIGYGREVHGGRARRGGADDELGSLEVFQRLGRRGVPDSGDLDLAISRADPVEPGGVEFGGLRLEKWRRRQPIDGKAERRAGMRADVEQ